MTSYVDAFSRGLRQPTPEEEAQWLAFLDEVGTTPAQLADARRRALAKMREKEPVPQPLPSWDEFMSRYTDEQLRAIRIETVLEARIAHHLHQATINVSPGVDIGEHCAQVKADVLDKREQWRREIEAKIDAAAREQPDAVPTHDEAVAADA